MIAVRQTIHETTRTDTKLLMIFGDISCGLVDRFVRLRKHSGLHRYPGFFMFGFVTLPVGLNLLRYLCIFSSTFQFVAVWDYHRYNSPRAPAHQLTADN